MEIELNMQTVLSEMGKIIDRHGEEFAGKVFKFVSEINEVAQRTDEKVRNVGTEMIYEIIKDKATHKM